MIDLKEYYFGSFESALDSVIGTHLPRWFGGTWHNHGCPELRALAEEQRPAFVTCLYYSVLLDQGLCHHAHGAYKNAKLFDRYPKFCPGFNRGHMNPRGILRYPMHWGLVLPEELMELAAPAARLFITEFVDTVQTLFPQVYLPNVLYLLPRFPEVDFWELREMRKFPRETAVEKKFLVELLAAIRECGF
ncbi:MAG: hypothetical protein WAN65_10075 [Candidatus Sulfotelmatobacter sp.]